MVNSLINSKYLKICLILTVFLGIIFTNEAFAKAGDGTIADVANNIQASFSNIAKLITGAAYVTGMGFTLAALFKLKAHKDSPTQIPVMSPIILLFVGAAMIFLPQVMTTVGYTMFHGKAQVGTVRGVETFGFEQPK